MINTATSLISDLIGDDSENSAFIYGSYSCIDKVANGALLYWLVAAYPKNAMVLKWVMGTVPVICVLCSMMLSYYGNKHYSA